jgi:hypothetical protein
MRSWMQNTAALEFRCVKTALYGWCDEATAVQIQEVEAARVRLKLLPKREEAAVSDDVPDVRVVAEASDGAVGGVVAADAAEDGDGESVGSGGGDVAAERGAQESYTNPRFVLPLGVVAQVVMPMEDVRCEEDGMNVAMIC